MAKTVIKMIVTCDDHDTTKWAAKKMAQCMEEVLNDEKVEAMLSVNERVQEVDGGQP